MRKIMKRAFAAVIVAVMVLCAAPLSGIADFITTAQAAGGYRVGDILTFGSYPQTTVNDDYLRAKLAEQKYDSKGILIITETDISE